MNMMISNFSALFALLLFNSGSINFVFGCKVCSNDYDSSYFFELSGPITPTLGNAAGKVSVDGDSFYATFDFTITSSQDDAWPSILQVGDWNGERYPGFWLYSNGIPKLTIRVSDQTSIWSTNYDPPQELNIGQKYNIQVMSCGGTITSYLDNVEQVQRTDRIVNDVVNKTVYIGAPWEQPANVILENIAIRPCIKNPNKEKGEKKEKREKDPCKKGRCDGVETTQFAVPAEEYVAMSNGEEGPNRLNYSMYGVICLIGIIGMFGIYKLLRYCNVFGGDYKSIDNTTPLVENSGNNYQAV